MFLSVYCHSTFRGKVCQKKLAGYYFIYTKNCKKSLNFCRVNSLKARVYIEEVALRLGYTISLNSRSLLFKLQKTKEKTNFSKLKPKVSNIETNSVYNSF